MKINKKLVKLLKYKSYGLFITYRNSKQKIEIFKNNVSDLIVIAISIKNDFIPLTKLTYLKFEFISKKYTEHEFKFYNMYNLFLLSYLYEKK